MNPVSSPSTLPVASVSPPDLAPAAMGRQRIVLHCDDLSHFAKTLRSQLQAHHEREAAVPGHQTLLNMLARAAGHRNLQALLAHSPPEAAAMPAQAAPSDPTTPEPDPWADTALHGLPTPSTDEAIAPPPRTPLSANAAKALTQFDAWGRLSRWPHKFSVQRLAMWVLWTRFEAGRIYREREVNDILKAWNTWGDHVTPRRELVEMGLLSRESDCSAYWKQPQQPNDEVRALLRALRSRRPAAAGVVATQR